MKNREKIDQLNNLELAKLLYYQSHDCVNCPVEYRSRQVPECQDRLADWLNEDAKEPYWIGICDE